MNLDEKYDKLEVRLGRIEDWAGTLVLCTFIEVSFYELTKIDTKKKGLKQTLDDTDEAVFQEKTGIKKSAWLESFISVAYNDPSRNEIVHKKLPDRNLVNEILDTSWKYEETCCSVL